MNLDYNATTSKLYRWFYSTSIMPKSLCPYFWKLCVMWLMIIPYSLVILPAIMVGGAKVYCSFAKRLDTSMRIYFTILLVSILLIPIIGLFDVYPVGSALFDDLMLIGLFTWVCVILLSIIVSLILLVNYFADMYKDYNVEKFLKEVGQEKSEPKPSIIIEFIKSSYKKYCPKINWENDKYK